MTLKPLTAPTAYEPKIVQLSLDLIRRDGGTQSRAALNSTVAGDYAKAMRDGAKFPEPVVFYGPDNREGATDLASYYWLAAGFHRCHAYEENGTQAIFCKVYEGTVREAILYSVGENHRHGFQRTNEDKRRAVRLLLSDRLWATRTDGWIAEKCRVSPPFVGHLRAALENERHLRQAHDLHASKNGTSSLETVSSDNGPSAPPPPPEDSERPREGRDRNGGTRTLRTENVGKGTKAKIKPVLVETELEQIAKKMAQIVRSIPKAVRQAKALGWTWEKFVEENQKLWDEIPVTTE